MNSGSVDVLVLAGSSYRCSYFALKILESFPNSVLMQQRSRPRYSDDTPAAVLRHFTEFEATEKASFKDYVEENADILAQRTIKKVTSKTLNSSSTVESITSLNPKFIAVHSTSIISGPLIYACPFRIINLHAGLSPYYRGSATNVFPLVNGEPQYIGMTVHFIDEGIDSGSIILQGRPHIEAGDNCHTIGCKNVVLGTELMIRVLRRCMEEGAVPRVSQDLSRGKLYYARDFTPEVVAKLNQSIAEGLIREYSQNPVHVDLVGELI